MSGNISVLDKKLESIPEEFHDLILEGYTDDQKIGYISKLEAKGLFNDRVNSQKPVGRQTNPGEQKINEESLNAQQHIQNGYNNNIKIGRNG